MYELDSNELYLKDKITGEKILLTTVISDLVEEVSLLRSENIETTNQLYELQNQIDMMTKPVETLKNFVLGD